MIWLRIGEDAGEDEPDDGTDSRFFFPKPVSLGLGEYNTPVFFPVFPVGVSGVVRGVGKPEDIISLMSEN
jgi:hypothetical protein